MAKIDYSLYLVADRSFLGERDLLSEVRKAVKGGATVVQLRDKEMPGRPFYELALALKNELMSLNIPLIINDRLDIALAVDADGIHLGQSDIPVSVARRLLGPDRLVGLSVGDIGELKKGVEEGADYFGLGPVYYTDTKKDIIQPTGLAFLQQCRNMTGLPLVAIGGINGENIARIKETGVDGIAVISAILGSDDVEAAARGLVRKWREN